MQEGNVMKKIIKICTFLTLMLSTISFTSVQKNNFNAVIATDGWEETQTSAYATNTVTVYDGSDAYFYIKLSTNDYNSCPTQFSFALSNNYYKVTDYNFFSYIELSNDNKTYIPLSNVVRSDMSYFFNDGTFRFGLNLSTKTIEEVAYQYVRILKGCEFPSYNYCSTGSNKKKYVQSETTISTRGSTSLWDSKVGSAEYKPYVEKKTIAFTSIAPGWNNLITENTPDYRHLILQFGTHGVDYLASSKTADATNRATSEYDIGNKLTINGIPIYRIKELYPLTTVSYAHGFGYLYICFPTDLFKITLNYLVPTLHIEEDTEFIDVKLPELTLKLAGDSWLVSDNESITFENKVYFPDYALVNLPYSYPKSSSFALASNLPSNGCSVAFNINTGDFDLTNANAAVHIVLYGFTVAIFEATGTIILLDSTGELQRFNGYTFAKNTTYTLEFKVSCGDSSKIKFAINHLLVIDKTIAKDASDVNGTIWTLDTLGTWSVDVYQELETYKPSLNYGGSSVYDFNEGDAAYNFYELINPTSLYDENVDKTYAHYIYSEGALDSENKYNAGIHTLTINLVVDEQIVDSKNITIKVHGKISTAKISYDDGAIIEVPVGSKLVPPSNPETYREGEYDYVFDGWYFAGAKWDFENDIVAGDMHLVSKYKATAPHYKVNVNFEGISKLSELYSLKDGTNLPFNIFDLEGATYKVYKDEEEISSLIVNEDVTLTVKYQVNYTYVEEVEETCLTDGHVGYWYSSVYPHYYFADASGKELISNPFIEKLNHDLEHLEYQDSTCCIEGHKECYYCKNCHKYFRDENASEELLDYRIEKKEHILTYHEQNAATCLTSGNKEYWTCTNEEGVYYGDEACSFTLDSIIIPANGHHYDKPIYRWFNDGDTYKCEASINCLDCEDQVVEVSSASITAKTAATCLKNGEICYFVKFIDDRFSSQTKIISIDKLEHDYTLIEEVKASKESIGIKEHYECQECHKYFIKDGENYKEVSFDDLTYEYVSQNGCAASISSVPYLLIIIGGVFILLNLLKLKEEK